MLAHRRHTPGKHVTREEAGIGILSFGLRGACIAAWEQRRTAEYQDEAFYQKCTTRVGVIMLFVDSQCEMQLCDAFLSWSAVQRMLCERPVSTGSTARLPSSDCLKIVISTQLCMPIRWALG
jgi:hypothetical protein